MQETTLKSPASNPKGREITSGCLVVATSREDTGKVTSAEEKQQCLETRREFFS